MYSKCINYSQFQDSKNQLILPQIIYTDQTKEKVLAIIYNVNGKKYYLSNENGHKVYSLGVDSMPRPMTKKEFKQLCSTLILNSKYYNELEDQIITAVEQLDFSKGHANSTFEIAKSCLDLNPLGTLVMNIGNAKYFYNTYNDSVYHIDHSKLILGRTLKETEKEKIISKISTSKTMTKKINKVLHY